MPRPTSVPKLTLHKASGKAVVRLSGVDVYCGVYGTPEATAAYDRAVAEWLARGRAPDPGRKIAQAQQAADAGVSVNEVLLAFWRHAERHYRGDDGKPTSQLAEYRQTIRVVRELYGLEPAVKFGPLALKAVRERMVHEELSRTEVNRRVALARRIFKWAAGEELVPFDVYHRLTAVTGLQKGRTKAQDPEPVVPVEERHVEATLQFLNSQVRGLIEFIRLTGCRPGEACRLRMCDVDATGPVWLYRPPRHKNKHRGKGRVVPIGPKAQELLAAYPTASPGDYVFSPRRAVEELLARRAGARATPKYPSHVKRNAGKRKVAPKRAAGERYTTPVLDRAVHRAIDRANKALTPSDAAEAPPASPLPYWRPNQLRHAHGTAVRKRYGLEAAQVVLGHARADVTQVYAARDLSLAEKVAAEIG